MKHPIEIYRSADGQAQVEVRFGQETAWLRLQQNAAERKQPLALIRKTAALPELSATSGRC
ncbi:MAG: hypothetical protein Q4A11_06785 [Brachymonas sp.]|nr:hypothetical protein [Brachymonas sp.]